MPAPNEIPDQFAAALLAYVERYEPPGHFLTAVLANDLVVACEFGSAVGMASVPSILAWLRQHDAPVTCWGTRARVIAWTAKYNDGIPF